MQTHRIPDCRCRVTGAFFRLHADDLDLEFVAGAGHSDSEPGLVDAMVRATERFKAVLQA